MPRTRNCLHDHLNSASALPNEAEVDDEDMDRYIFMTKSAIEEWWGIQLNEIAEFRPPPRRTTSNRIWLRLVLVVALGLIWTTFDFSHFGSMFSFLSHFRPSGF